MCKRFMLDLITLLLLAGYGGMPTFAAPVSSTRDRHIAELRDDLVNVAARQPDVDVVLRLETWFIAPSPYWNEANPEWPTVFARVKEDIAPDLLVTIEKNRSHAYAFWNATLATHLSEAEIDELLRYFRSEQGKQYLAFQRSLDDLSQHPEPRWFGRPSFEFPSGDPPSDDVIRTRIRLLGLSLSSLLVSQQGATKQPEELNKFDESIESNALSEMVIARGSDLDRLDQENRRELDAFAKFNQSNLMSKMIAGVVGDMKQDTIGEKKKPPSNDTAAIARHLSIWQADYGAAIAAACGTARAKMDSDFDKPQAPDRPDLSAWQKTLGVAQAAASDLLRASRPSVEVDKSAR
jgi:hypothetical protein